MSLRGEKRRRINLTIEHATLKIQISNQRTVVLRYQAQPIRITNQLNKRERNKNIFLKKEKEKGKRKLYSYKKSNHYNHRISFWVLWEKN